MNLQNKTKEHGRWYDDACGAAFAMELIGERWSLLVIRELMLGPRRFSDIRASLPGLSAKVLTERLERLADVGILVRRKLPPPAASQVFELTEWGYGLEEVMQALGRWSVRSPLHDPGLPLTPVSFLLSLRTMIVPEKAGDLDLCVEFATSDERLFAVLAHGDLRVSRGGEPPRPLDIVFRGDTVTHFLGVFYGKRHPEECGVSIEGDRKLAERFADLFALPPKCGLPVPDGQ